MLWKNAEGCSHCEAVMGLPRPCPYYVWVVLTLLATPLVYAVFNRIRQEPLPFGTGGAVSLMLAALCVWLAWVVAAKQMPDFVGGYELTVMFFKLADGALELHVHKRRGQSVTAYIEGVPVSPSGKLGSLVQLSVRDDACRLGWSVYMRPTGRVIDACLAQSSIGHVSEENYQAISFSSWGDLLYAACEYSSVDDLLGGAARIREQRKRHEADSVIANCFSKGQKGDLNLLRATCREVVASLSASVGLPVNIPVDEDPMNELIHTTAVVLNKLDYAGSLLTKQEQYEKEVSAAVVCLAEALEVEFKGDYTLTGKLTHVSLHGAELFPEQRRKLTKLTARVFEAETLTHTLGHAMMELRLWMSRDVQIRSKLFAQVRRFFQEVVTPQILESAPHRDYLREWYEEAKKAENQSLLDSLAERQLYRGDFDDILGAPPISHTAGAQVGRRSRHRKPRT